MFLPSNIGFSCKFSHHPEMGWSWSPSGWLDKLHGWFFAAPTSFFCQVAKWKCLGNPLSLPSFGLINANVYHKYHNFFILETPSVLFRPSGVAAGASPGVPDQLPRQQQVLRRLWDQRHTTPARSEKLTQVVVKHLVKQVKHQEFSGWRIQRIWIPNCCAINQE